MANGHTSYYGLVCGPHLGSNNKWYTILPRSFCAFKVYTEHVNVAVGCVIQPGRPHTANGSWVLYHLLTPCCTEVMNLWKNVHESEPCTPHG
jgi:hypothetical protein